MAHLVVTIDIMTGVTFGGSGAAGDDLGDVSNEAGTTNNNGVSNVVKDTSNKDKVSKQTDSVEGKDGANVDGGDNDAKKKGAITGGTVGGIAAGGAVGVAAS